MDAILVLAEDLVTFELTDLVAGLDSVGLRAQREGEKAIPEIGALIAAVNAATRQRRDEERDRIALVEHNAAKARWERERAEDLASGRQMTEQEKRLDEIIRAQKDRRKTKGYVPTAEECESMAGDFKGERA